MNLSNNKTLPQLYLLCSGPGCRVTFPYNGGRRRMYHSNSCKVNAYHEVLALVRFDDLVNLEAEILQLYAQLDDLRAPVPVEPTGHPEVDDALMKLADLTAKAETRGARVCPNHHLVDESGKCMAKGCPYSRGYKAKKEKRK